MRYRHPTEIPRSKTLSCIEWTGDRIPVKSEKRRGDTHPMTWAADGEIYIGTGDPNWYELNGKIYVIDELSDPQLAEYIYRRITGLCCEKLIGEARRFDLERVNDMDGFIGSGRHGAKPCGMISVDGKLYFAVQNLLGWKPPRYGTHSQHASDATILMSEDYGKTWTPDINDQLYKFHKENHIRGGALADAWKIPAESRTNVNGFYPMFPGCWFGGPSFVQFGQNNADAVDDYVYAVSADQWDNGSDMRLGRVQKHQITNRDAWEFAIPTEGNGVKWTKNIYMSEPVLAIERHVSTPEMVYIPRIKKYITATWAFHEDFRASTGSELTIHESDNPWGPFSLVYYEWMWYKEEAGCYCPRIPLKWFNQETLEGYLEFSGNWETQLPYYMPQLRPFKFICKQ